MRSLSLINGILLSIVVLSATFVGCGDPSPIGAGVLDGERLNLKFTDTVQLTTKTVVAKPLSTYRKSPILNLRNRILGELDDPITGITRSEVYSGFEIPVTSPNFTNGIVDSVVLSITYDSVGFYGDADAMHDIEIFGLANEFPDQDTIFSDQELMKGALLGSKSTHPSFTDSVRIIEHGVGTALTLKPHLRIQLDDSFGQQILDNPSVVENDTIFSTFFPGIAIKSTPDRSSSFGLNMLSTENASTINGIVIYYTIGDTAKLSYRLTPSTNISSYIEQDRSGSPLESFIDNTTIGDSLIVIQGQSGVDAELEIGSLEGLKDEVINHAELISFIYRDPIINPDFYEPHPLLLAEYDDDNALVSIEDFNIGFSSGGLEELFGGTPQDTVVNGNSLEYIRLNITSHLKSLIEDSEKDKTLIFNVTSKIQRPGRTILYGPGHSLYPMKLNVTFTDIN